MPRPYVDPDIDTTERPAPRVEDPGLVDDGSGHTNGRKETDHPKAKRQGRRWFSWLSLNRLKRRSPSTDEPATDLPDSPVGDDASSATAPAIDEGAPTTERKRNGALAFLNMLYEVTLKPPTRTKKRKKPRRQTKSGAAIKWTLVLVFILLAIGALRGIRASNAIVKERAARAADVAKIEGQLKQLGASSVFPLEDAFAKAERLASECFSVPNAGATADTEDFLALQNEALADAGIPVSDKVNCGWDGKGRGQVISTHVVKDDYWIQADRATIVLQLKLYQRRGFIYYYVPFTSSNGVAKYAGMPAIFGTASGAENFMTVCSDPDTSIDSDKLQRTAQLFVSALAGEGDLDLGYLTYEGAKFGSFSPTVSSPKVTQVKYCGATGDERRFAAMVQFKGPIQGSTYTLPYAFSVVPNPETSGRYQVKHFGPAPGYTGA